nr:MAG TPA: hypothetical protein [Caudoviricetes sp.]
MVTPKQKIFLSYLIKPQNLKFLRFNLKLFLYHLKYMVNWRARVYYTITKPKG